MANIIEIADIKNPCLDVYCRLTEAQLKNKLDREKGLFIAESPNVIKYALERGYEPVSLLMERKRIEGSGKEIIEKAGEIPIYTADGEILESLTGYPLTRGILCAMKRPALKKPEEILEGASRVAVLEDIVDTTNVGAIFRSAAALGIDAVLLTPSCSDPLNRRTVRVSMGTVFQVPWTYLGENISDWPGKGLTFLHERGFASCAMALWNNSVSIDDECLKKEDKLAIILGTEGAGLKRETIEQSTYTVKIPMQHGVDSLNVASASAVAFWELRKR